MDDFQKRVIVEKVELDTKTSALRKFITGDVFKTLESVEQEDLKAQVTVMRQYSNLLESRISRFQGSATSESIRPNKSETEIEQDIQDKGLNAPRLTPDLIDSCIKDVDYYRFSNGTMMVCCITLENGFSVTGNSACASPENFIEELGKDISFKRAREQIWQLEGYLLKQKLHDQ